MASVIAVVLVAASATGVQPASAQHQTVVKVSGTPVLYNQHGGSVPVGYCPNTACYDRSFGNGSAVQMLCYADMSAWTLGNYWSPRWFYIKYSNWFGVIYRWVHSSYVYYQTGVGRC